MPRNGQLTLEHFNDLVNAITRAFPTQEELELLVKLKLGVGLNSITRLGQHQWMVLKVVEWAESRGPKLDDLVVGALNQNPDNLELLSVAQELGLDEGASEFEAFVLESAPPADVEDWHSQMRTCERAVCRVEGPKYGTGFLVGPDLVVTNYHVVDRVIAGKAKPQNIVLRFDYKKKANGTSVQKGVEYHLKAGTNWLAASSPIEKLDYALLRVAGKPEEGTVAGQPGAPARGYLIPKAHTFEKGDPLLIIQHPEKSPLKFAIGHVEETGKPENRVSYKVNTAQGSSGAPCFTVDWQPVALHHWGSEKQKINRGVVFSTILEEWNKDKQLSSELGY